MMTLQENIETKNMAIWEQVCTTDKATTKEATGKGFACISINPQSIWEKLTRLFGPVGIGWGYQVLGEEYKAGHTDGENTVVLHVLCVGLWYVWDGVKSEPVQAYGQTYLVRDAKSGWTTDEEAPKKSLTDALSKAASMLGVSADIYSGKWDGHKDQSGASKPVAKKQGGMATKKCPECGVAAIIPSKFKGAAFVCYKKKGGCGTKFADEAALKGQDDIPLDTPSTNGEYIGEADRRKIHAKKDSIGWTDQDLKDLLIGSFGIESTKEIPANKFEEILSYVSN